MRDNSLSLFNGSLPQSTPSIRSFNPAIFSTLGIFLSSLSGMLFHYQQYITAGVIYLVAMILHGLQTVISSASHPLIYVSRLSEDFKLHLSNTVVISLILTSQLSSPLPGMILAMIVVANMLKKYVNRSKMLYLNK